MNGKRYGWRAHSGVDESEKTPTKQAIWLSVLAMGALGWAGPAAWAAPSFFGMGYLGDGSGYSRARGVSADGLVVVGTSARHAVRWTEESGIESLGCGDDRNYGAFAASDDGSVIVGSALFGSHNPEAFRWTAEEGVTWLGTLAPPTLGHVGSVARGVSANGSVIVGNCVGPPHGDQHAFRWTASQGMMDMGFGHAYAVSANGGITVGGTGGDESTKAFRCIGTHREDIGWLAVGGSDDAFGVSRDGTKIVGRSAGNMFLWTEEGGMEDLGYGAGLAVLDDASMIVGYRHATPTTLDDPGDRAIVWDREHGIRLLRNVLIHEHGLDEVRGWELYSADAMSADGRVIVGWGLNPNGNYEGWIATIPEPSALALLTFGGLAVIQRKRLRSLQ